MQEERMARRISYLQALNRRSEEEPWTYWHATQLVENYSVPQIQDAVQYLEEKGFIKAIHAGGDDGQSLARITAAGHDFLSDPGFYALDASLGVFAQATINYNTTHVTQSVVGNLASGGAGHSFSGSVTIFSHPQADALRDAFQAFDTALAQDTTLDGDTKDEIAHHELIVRQELAKPRAEQDAKKAARRWERVTALVDLAAPLFEIGSTIHKILTAHQGG